MTESIQSPKRSLTPWVLTVVVAIIFAAGGFFGGIKYQQSKPPTFSGRGGNGMFLNTQGGVARIGNGANRGNTNGFRPVAGEIIGSDDKSITVKLQDGSTKIVIVPDSIAINKATSGSKSDLTNGTQVAVFGTDNSDGSVTAQNIQINPIIRVPAGSPTP